MKTRFRFTPFTVVLFSTFLLLGSLLLSGCADNAFTEQGEATVQPPSKMRQAHLFGQSDGAGKIVARYAELLASNDFIIGTSDIVLDINKVVERYDDIEGTRIKRIFRKSFLGFSIHVKGDGPMTIPGFLDIIENDDEIAWIEPEPKFSPWHKSSKIKNMPNTQHLVSSLMQANGQQSSAYPGDGAGSVDLDLYIIDTGVEHPDLNVVERIDFTADGYDIDMTKIVDRYEETMDPFSDPNGHGTHVAGIAAAIDDADDLVGTAPGARIHDFKVFDQTGQAEMSAVIAALDVVEARKLLDPSKPMVVNLSLGADIGTTLYNALDEAVISAIEAGVVVVVAAGNQSIDASTVTPAHVAEAITVGSVKSASFSSFSNYGLVVDIMAPGETVMSFSTDFHKTVEMSGTSMAVPLVSGAALLYLWNNPTASPQQVRDAIVSTGLNVNGAPANTTNLRLDLSNF